MEKRTFISLVMSLVLLAGCVSVQTASTGIPATAQATASPVAMVKDTSPLSTSSAGLQRASGSYQFTEGSAADAQGQVFFSDVNAGKIYRWSPDGSVTVFIEGLKGPNGLAFNPAGLLIACEGGAGRVISIDPKGQIQVLTDQYQGKRFNEPNDLWIDAQGGTYFTDPVYQSQRTQPVEAVYYLAAGQAQASRVIDDLLRPNGIVGTPDGKTLYVADHGAGKTYAYTISGPGQLTGKRLFADSGSDGMDLDAAGSLYLTTTNKILVYDPSGKRLREISLPEDPTNVAFTGKDRQTLFITARTAVYTTQISGMPALPTAQATPALKSSGFTLTSPVVSEGGALPAEYTCDGASSTPALAWSGAPAGTQSYALIMHHEASPTDIHWYWVIYNIPASVTSLPKNMTGIGTLGTNSVDKKQAYTPPCSKGPGAKTYTYTVYALSAQPALTVAANQVNRAALLDAIRGITLASAQLNVTYSRP